MKKPKAQRINAVLAQFKSAVVMDKSELNAPTESVKKAVALIE